MAIKRIEVPVRWETQGDEDLPPNVYWVSDKYDGPYGGNFNTKEQALAYEKYKGKPDQIPGLKEAADAATGVDYYDGNGDLVTSIDPAKRQEYIDRAMNSPLDWVGQNVDWSGTGYGGDFSALDKQVQFLKDNKYDTSTLDKGALNQYNLTKQILDQGTTSKWSGAGFGSPTENAKQMARVLNSAGIEDIKDFGKIKKDNFQFFPVQEETDFQGNGTGKYFTVDVSDNKSYVDPKDVSLQQFYDPEGFSYQAPSIRKNIGTEEVYGNKKTNQAITQDYNAAGGNIFSGTYAGHGRTNYGVKFLDDGTPVFYTQFGGDTSSMADIAPIISFLSVIPSPLQPFAAAANALISIDNGNTLGALASLAGIPGVSEAIGAAGLATVAEGIQTANKVVNLVNAVESGNVVALAAAAGSALGAGSTEIGDTGFTVSDAMKAANLVKAIDSGDPTSIFNAAVGFAQSPNINKALNNQSTTITADGQKVADLVDNNFVAELVNPNSDSFLGNSESSINTALALASEVKPVSSPVEFEEKLPDLLAPVVVPGAENLANLMGGQGVNVAGPLSVSVALPYNLENLPKDFPVPAGYRVLSREEMFGSPREMQDAGIDVRYSDDIDGRTALLVPESTGKITLEDGQVNIATTTPLQAVDQVPSAITSGGAADDDAITTLANSGGSEDAVTLLGETDNVSQPAQEQPAVTTLEPSITPPEALVPDASNPNLEAGKTPQERAAEEWQRYLDSLENKPADLDLPGSTIEAGEYWDEYNANLKRIMDKGGYTSQWQNVNGDKVFVNDDGTAIGITQDGGTYPLSNTQVEEMVGNGLLNTAESGYVDATGGTGNTPGGTLDEDKETESQECPEGYVFNLNTRTCVPVEAEPENPCGEGFHFDEARGICVADTDTKEDEECPEGYVRNLNTGACELVSTSPPPSRPPPPSASPPPPPPPPPRRVVQNPTVNPAEPPISRAIPDEPMRRIGLPIYEKMSNFEGPLSDFLEMVQKGSYISKPTPEVQPMQPNMNQQPDRLDQPDQTGGNYFNYGQESSIDNILNPGAYQGFKQGGMATPLMAAGGTTRYGMNSGGALDVVHHSGKPRLDFRKGAAVTGKGDGQSDDIPAMLADGEFVFPADVVAALGNGSTKAGSDKLYEMMHAIRAYHRSAKPEDLPPPAKKSPLDYLKTRKARG